MQNILKNTTRRTECQIIRIIDLILYRNIEKFIIDNKKLVFNIKKTSINSGVDLLPNNFLKIF